MQFSVCTLTVLRNGHSYLYLGGFIAGFIVPHDNGFAISIVEKLEDLVSILFIPIVCQLFTFNRETQTQFIYSISRSLASELIWAYLIRAYLGLILSSFAWLHSLQNSVLVLVLLITLDSTGARLAL